MVIKEGIAKRLTDSIETALKLSGGIVTALLSDGSEQTFSENYACPEHGVSVPELAPRMFSFNSPFGACPTCTGLGIFMKVNPLLVVPDESKSLAEGCIRASGWGYLRLGCKRAGHHGSDVFQGACGPLRL